MKISGHYKIDHRFTCQDRDCVSVHRSPYGMIYSKTCMACYILGKSSEIKVHTHSDDMYQFSFAHNCSN